MRTVVHLLLAVLVAELTVRAVLVVPAARRRLYVSLPWDTGAEVAWHAAWVGAGVVGPGLPDGLVTPELAYDPVTGWRPRPGVDGVDATGRRQEGLDRADAPVRLAVFGDSFTFGAEAAPADTWARQLEDRHPQLDVVNFGTSGFGLHQVLAATRAHLPAADADAALLLLIGADLPRSAARFFAYAMPSVDPDDATSGALATVPPPHEVARRVRWRPRLVDLGRIVAERRAWRARLSRQGRAALAPRNAALLDAWVGAVRATGAEPIVLYVPTPVDLRNARDPEEGWTVASDRAFVAAWCARGDLVCVDGFDAVDAASPELERVTSGGHWSREGHRVIADVVDAVWPVPRPVTPPAAAR